MNLFRCIFSGDEAPGRYPESLVEEAIERAVDGTDARLRVLSGYRKALRDPAIHAIDHVVALVDSIPACVPVGIHEHGEDPRLAALFASAEDMLGTLGRDRALGEFLASANPLGGDPVKALLLAQRAEKHVLGVELDGDMLRRDVQQVAVSFAGHRLLDPSATEAETRRYLRRRAYDHLLAIALARIAEVGAERADLARQRDLLKRKLDALEHGGWTFETRQDDAADPAALLDELSAVEEQLAALGPSTDVLGAHREIVADTLGQAERQLWAEYLTLYLDRLNIQREPRDPSARRIDFQELRNSRGRRLTILPVSLVPAELPPREGFLAAAQRYLY